MIDISQLHLPPASSLWEYFVRSLTTRRTKRIEFARLDAKDLLDEVGREALFLACKIARRISVEKENHIHLIWHQLAVHATNALALSLLAQVLVSMIGKVHHHSDTGSVLLLQPTQVVQQSDHIIGEPRSQTYGYLGLPQRKEKGESRLPPSPEHLWFD